VVVEDNPMPSPSATIIGVSLRLAELDPDDALKRQAVSALAISQEVLKKQPFAYVTQVQLIAAFEGVSFHSGAGD